MRLELKLSAIFDVGSTGLPVDTEMELEDNTAKKLKKALSRAVGKKIKNIEIMVSKDDEVRGKTVYLVKMLEIEDDETNKNNIRYEFVTRGTRTFLNVRSNPTVLLVGNNTLPVKLIDKTPLQTFKLMNRLAYELLEELLDGFEWTGADKSKIVNGHISIVQMQIAFYTGSLGTKRTQIMDYLKVIYDGLDMTSDRVFKLSKGLGLSVETHEEGNLTLRDKVGKNQIFSLCMYKKDEIINEALSIQRVSDLIRFDCTFYHQFLTNKGIKDVNRLEQKYEELCLDGSDRGFIKWLHGIVIDRIKLKYLIEVDRLRFKKSLRKAENDFHVTDGLEDRQTVMAKVFWDWYNGAEYRTQTEAAKQYGVSQVAVSKANIELKDKYHIDVDISRSYMMQMFDTRANNMLTMEERESRALTERGDNKKYPEAHVLHERADQRLKEIHDTLNQSGGILSVRRMTPVLVDHRKLFIYKQAGIKNPKVTWIWDKKEVA